MIFTLRKRSKRQLHDRKTVHFKAPFKAHFDILASSKTDCHCKVKETWFIQELQSPLNTNVSSGKLLLYQESFSIVSLYGQFPFRNVLNFYCRCFLFRFHTV